MAYKYDAFITYRGSHDSIQANSVCELLSRNKLKIAIDTKSFSPSETFFDEMARCVKESRYTVALISKHYATSHFTQEEAIMQKIIDNKEKHRRLIPCFIEDVEAPLWMQSIVGVRLFRDKSSGDFSELKKLVRTLKNHGEDDNISSDRTNYDVVDSKLELPKELVNHLIYGAAAHGVLSLLSSKDGNKAANVLVADINKHNSTSHAADQVLGDDATSIADSDAASLLSKTLKNSTDII